MLIRSQDKESIVVLENVVKLCFDDDYQMIKPRIYADFSDGETVVLGEYTYKSTAIRIMNMIQEQYAKFSCRYGVDCSDSAIFQMPYDNEEGA